MLLEPGQRIDEKYRIVRLLGQGGMGAVYEGHHELIDRRIAIKTILPSMEQQAAVVRFEREARAAGRIGNDHILEIYDIGALPGGGRYMVMEYLEGETLSSRIAKSGTLQPPEVAHITLQLLDGLGAAHGAGVLHRDLKPDNIFLVSQKAGIRDFVKLIDFGISKFSVDQPDEMRMTATGMVVGTPYYIPPEVAKGLGDADHRSDLYAVGVILYEALSGRVPFNADNFNNLLFQIVLEEPPALTSLVPNIDSALAALVHKAMARERDHRFQSAAEMAQALLGWAETAGIPLGTSVSLAPRMSLHSYPDARATAQLGAARGPATIQAATVQPSAIQAPTPGAFGASQPMPVSERKTAPILLAAGSAALVIGVVLAILLGGSPEEDTDTAATAQPEQATETQAATPEPPPPDSKPEPAPATPPSQAEPKPPKQPPSEQEPSEPKADETKGTKDDGKDATPTPSTPPRASTPPPRPAAAPRPAPSPPPPPSTSQPERTRWNFGY